MLTSPASLPNPATGSPVRLLVRGLGPLFNFKNSKFLARGRMMTDPDLKRRMEAITQSFASQLRSHFQIADGATLTDAQLRCLTLSLPHDDCWTAVPELVVSAKLVAEGEEGAEILIERI